MTLGIAHLALVGTVAALAAGGTAYVHGIRVGIAQEQAAQARAAKAADKVRDQVQGAIDVSAQRHQATEYDRQSSVREIYHESEKIVERPVFRSVCIDADGVGLLDRAAATANDADLGDAAGAAAAPAPRPAE